MVECTGLENRRTARYRGFESLFLRVKPCNFIQGFFNLGCALSFVQTLNPGVYITMQGEYFNWNEVKKNKKFGFFEKII